MQYDVQKATSLSAAFRLLRSGIATVAVFSLIINLTLLTTPLYMLQVADRVLISGSVSTLALLTLVAVLVIAIGAALEGVRAFLLSRLSARTDRLLAAPVAAAVLGQDMYRRDGSCGQPIRDLETMRAFTVGTGLTALCDAPWIPLFLLVITLMHPTLGMVAIAGSVVLFALTVAAGWATREAFTQAAQNGIGANRFFEGSLRNAEVAQALGMVPALIGHWDKPHRAEIAEQARAIERNALFLASAKFVRPAIFIGILGFGALLVLEQSITAGTMIAASILMGRVLAPIEGVIGNWRQLVAARGAKTRLMQILRHGETPAPVVELPRPHGHLVVDRIFGGGRRHGRAVVNGVKFEIQAGESLGIVGPSGAGKSTLARLLLGISETESGFVRIDGADITQWSDVSRARYLGYLPQDIGLFEGTVAENICRFGPVDSDQILAAAKMAGAHNMILSLPDGYDTHMGAGGAGLSGGQKQRIALARALFGQPAVVVLDEPNAHLDGEGELALRQVLANLKQMGTTTIVVAHRPAILTVLDKLLVLRNGEIEQFGACEQVMRAITRPAPVPGAAAGKYGWVR